MNRIHRLCALLVFICAIAVEGIDWEYEAARDRQLFYQEYDERLTHKLVRDVFSPGFVRITPNSSIEGDFDALEEYFTRSEHKGHQIIGPPQFVTKCENTALGWGNTTYFDKNCNRKYGTYVILWEYIGGKAKTKLFHSTV